MKKVFLSLSLLGLLVFPALTHAAEGGTTGSLKERVILREERKLEVLDTELSTLEGTYAFLTGTPPARPFPLLKEIIEETGSAPLSVRFENVRYYAKLYREQIWRVRHNLDLFGTKLIHIDLSEQMATMIEDGVIIGNYQVSSGIAASPTPQGKFRVHWKQDLRISNQGTPYRMPNYLAFTKNGGYGIHALPYLGGDSESSAYWREAREHIGKPVSHGCVRLLPEDSDTVYAWAEIGTAVYIVK